MLNCIGLALVGVVFPAISSVTNLGSLIFVR